MALKLDFATGTTHGGFPLETTRLTVAPGARVPLLGESAITSPFGTVRLEAKASVPTAQWLAAIRDLAEASDVCAGSFGTVQGGGGTATVNGSG